MYLQKFCHMSGVHFKIDSSHRFTTPSLDEGGEVIIGLTKTPSILIGLLSLQVFLHYPCYLSCTHDSIYSQKELDFIATY
jgi:hypothetical protein